MPCWKGKIRRGERASFLAAAEHWRHNVGRPATVLDDALTCLAWAALATDPAAPWEPSLRDQVLTALDQVVRDVGTLDADTQPLLHLWLQIELPLMLRTADRTAGSAPDDRPPSDPASQLALAWPAWCDAEGLPHAATLSVAWPLLAAWVRCARLAACLGGQGWSDNLREQFENFLQQMLRLCLGDGTVAFHTRDELLLEREFLEAALALTCHDDTRVLAECCRVVKARRGRARSTPEGLLLSDHAETAGIALLRSDWSSQALQVAAAIHGSHLQLAVAAAGRPLFNGDWEATVTVDGQIQVPCGSWREVVWFSDEEIDYWEVELPLEDGWMLNRQLLLCRSARWLLLSDTVQGERPAEIECRVQLPCGEGVGFVGAAESHEGWLRRSQDVGLVLPLWLPEWRAEAADGALTAEQDRLVATRRRTGSHLYLPLVLVGDSRQLRLPYTWRRLTVAESLQIVSTEQAVGMRMQLGKKQWLFYRSLTRPANRSVLGQNVADDFLAAELQPDGQARPLVRIET